MEITIEQCENKRIKKINNILYLDDKRYKDNDILLGFINNVFVEGRLHISESNLYFLQNLKNGSRPVHGLISNFSKSWQFGVEDFQGFTSNVKLFNYKKETDFNIEELELKYPITNFITDSYSNFIERSTNNILFKLKQVPHCCGAVILSDFRENEAFSLEYDFSEEEIKELNFILKKNMTTNKIAYLLKEKESKAIEFLVEKLNFKIIDEFKNNNTGNSIQILSRNDIH